MDRNGVVALSILNPNPAEPEPTRGALGSRPRAPDSRSGLPQRPYEGSERLGGLSSEVDDRGVLLLSQEAET
jgi:hypothetical protein